MNLAISKIVLCILFCFSFNISSASESLSDFDQFFCREYKDTEKTECKVYHVSIINLITTPELFHEKRVHLFAYVSLDFEESALYLAPGLSPTERIGLSFWREGDKDTFETEADVDEYNRRKNEAQRKFNYKQVLIEGVFNMKAKSMHYRGMIYDITRMQLWWDPSKKRGKKK